MSSRAAEPSQLRLLLGMRWRMMRMPKQRRRFGYALALVPLLSIVAVTAGMIAALVASDEVRFNFALLAPTAFASFAVLAVLSPATSAGGSELFPSDQLVAYPISERTVFRSTLILAPANLAWVTHFVVLLGITAFVAAPGGLVVLALVTATAYAISITVVGQAMGWWLEGIRQHRAGRWSLRAFGAVSVVAVAAVHLSGNTTELLNRLPTQRIAISAVQGSEGNLRGWAPVVVALAALAAIALLLGDRGCRWALSRVSDGGLQPETKPIARRSLAHGPLLALMQIDRASVWRSAALRRGGLVMALLPGVIAAIARPGWDSLVLLTGLVAAGAGLLFGVNAFGMDGAGALTLEGLPISPRLRFWAKTIIVIEFCLVTSSAALVVGALRATEPPTATQVVSLLVSTVVCSLAVAAFCMRVSLRAPHRADLRGRRDTPAPPGAMIAYSARLAWRTTMITIVLSIVALTPWPWLPVMIAAPMALLAAWSLARSAGEWVDDANRSRVVAVVSSG